VIRLVRVELLRILSRRILRLLAALALVGIVTGGVVVFVRSHHPGASTGAAIRRAEQQRAIAVRKCASGEFGIPEGDIPPGETLQSFCEHNIGPSVSVDPEFHLTDIYGSMLGTDGFLIVLLLVLGATFVGAEWHAGSMATLLTWEPRRLRVFVAKAAATVIIAFVATLVVLALLGLALLPAAVVRGNTTGADGGWVLSVVGLVLRGGVLGAIAALIGLSVASVGRNTAAALGGAFAYFAVLESLIRGLRPRWQPWLLSDNVATFLRGHRSYFGSFARSPTAAVLWLCVITFAFAAVAVLDFRRRDVT
jgi:ABC-type transport system involved in multi-copper enzyme maturation permease subunit